MRSALKGIRVSRSRAHRRPASGHGQHAHRCGLAASFRDNAVPALVALVSLFAIGAPAPGAAQTGEPQVTLYVPALASDGPLGLRAATVLNLQIWKTLRRAPYPNPNGITFGTGLVLWDPSPLPQANHDSAVAAANVVGADMVLWGKAWRYGGGVAVQAYLTLIDAAADTMDRWTARVERQGAPVSLTVGLPRERYEFAPIILDSAVVESLESPAGLPIMAAKGSTEILGEVGSSFRALQQDGDWTLIQSGPVRGWLHLPQLSRKRSEVVDFVGGIIRLRRGDWAGAAQLLERVASNSAAPYPIRIDAHLMLALARSRTGGDRLGPIRRAYELNPHEAMTTKYECMEYVARLAAGPDAATSARLRQQLRGILDERSYLFSPQDPWFAKVRQLAGTRNE